MTLRENLVGNAKLAAIASQAQRPLTADQPYGYVDVAATTLRQSAALVLRDEADAVQRIRTAVQAAAQAGVPKFVLNVRKDVLAYDGSLRMPWLVQGRTWTPTAAAGFVWGGVDRCGVSASELRTLFKGLGGIFTVKMNLG